MKLRMIIELEYNEQDMHGDDKESYDWFICEVLAASPSDFPNALSLHSNLIGDFVGYVELISILPNNESIVTQHEPSKAD